MKKKTFNKKVFITKLILILAVGVILGISCIFSPAIEKFLGIGSKSSSYVSSEQISNNDMKIHFLDVGQADCTFIELPDGKNIMIDAGLSTSAKHIIEYVDSLGVSQIDYFILTHPDNDHVGGAKKIFEHFEIKNIIRPFSISVDSKTNLPTEYEKLGVYYTDIYQSTCNVITTNVYATFIQKAYTETYFENGIEKQSHIYVSYDGLKLPLDENAEYNFEFFAPIVRENAYEILYEETDTYGYPTKFYGKDTSSSKNNASPVMLLEYRESSFVFTGGAEEEVESDFLNQTTEQEKDRFKNVDVMQAGHHGSTTSNTAEFLNLVCPNYFVVSAGKDNKYGHPHDEIVNRVQNLPHTVSDYFLVTFEVGDITFGFDQTGKLLYTANMMGDGTTVYYYQIAICLFVVITVIILSVRVSKNKMTTAKNVVKETKRVSNRINKS